MITSKHCLVSVKLDNDGSQETFDLTGLSVLPNVGHVVALDYWHGDKRLFRVDSVRHDISNVGKEMLQQITLFGTAV